MHSNFYLITVIYVKRNNNKQNYYILLHSLTLGRVIQYRYEFYAQRAHIACFFSRISMVFFSLRNLRAIIFDYECVFERGSVILFKTLVSTAGNISVYICICIIYRANKVFRVHNLRSRAPFDKIIYYIRVGET